MMDNRLPREKKIGSSRSGALQKDAENKIERINNDDVLRKIETKMTIYIQNPKEDSWNFLGTW